MAKQTFTTGQVLTAAQMTSLQETAMGGGPATAKTTSYVLVAADAGKTVAMDAAGATTITVNTGLFAAGDTVFIQNLGAGACTVTAGTATVATAGSLILPQNDAGILYFTSASAAIFYDYIQAGAVSPLTTKGDLYTFSTSDARLPVGTNGHTLVADSAEATGLKWAAPSGGAMELISTFTTSGVNSIDFTSISTAYKQLTVVWMGLYASTNNTSIGIRFNNDSASNYKQREIMFSNTTMTNNFDQTTSISCQTRGRFAGYNTDVAIGYLTIHNSNSTTLYKYVETATSNKNSVTSGYEIKKGSYAYTSNTAITEINFVRTETAGTIQIDTGGYVQVWGIK